MVMRRKGDENGEWIFNDSAGWFTRKFICGMFTITRGGIIEIKKIESGISYELYLEFSHVVVVLLLGK